MRKIFASLLMVLAATILDISKQLDPEPVTEFIARVFKKAADASGMILVEADAKQEREIAQRVAKVAKYNRPDVFKD